MGWSMRCSTNPTVGWSDHMLTFSEVTTTKTATSSTATQSTVTTTMTTTTRLKTTTTRATTSVPLTTTTTTVRGSATAAPLITTSAPPATTPATTSTVFLPTTIAPTAAATTTIVLGPTTTEQPSAVTSSVPDRTTAKGSGGNTTVTTPPAGATSQQTLVFSGACDHFENLNGQVFTKKGTTATGAPFYQASTAEYYIYFDPNCATPGAPEPARWILDVDAPSTQRTADLDNDGKCNYLARTDSNEKKLPPSNAKWVMHCGNDDWQWREVVLQESYAKIGSGTCGAAGRTPILTASMCSAAAKYLQLSDTQPKLAEKSEESTPGGCYWDQSSSSLHLALHTSSKGKGATGSLEPICSDGYKKASALMSTAMGGNRIVAALGLLFPTFTLVLSYELR